MVVFGVHVAGWPPILGLVPGQGKWAEQAVLLIDLMTFESYWQWLILFVVDQALLLSHEQI